MQGEGLKVINRVFVLFSQLEEQNLSPVTLQCVHEEDVKKVGVIKLSIMLNVHHADVSVYLLKYFCVLSLHFVIITESVAGNDHPVLVDAVGPGNINEASLLLLKSIQLIVRIHHCEVPVLLVRFLLPRILPVFHGERFLPSNRKRP